MSVVSRAFTEGGPWMWIILLWGLALYGGVVIQLVRARMVDFSPVLWGGLVVLLALGMLGTAVGLIQAFHHIGAELTDAAARTQKIALAIAIALNTTTLAGLLAIPGAMATGIASMLARRHALVRVG